ncbi:MAG: Clp1/GlmU family protein [Desulfurococcaceae archaeon]
MPILKLAKDEAVKLYGPMSVVVRNGCIDVQGKLACTGEKFIIHKARNYVAEAVDSCELEVAMINDSQIQTLDSSDPYRVKKNIAREIAKRGFNRVVVVGCVDCGKTSFTTVLYNTLLACGRKPVVIDGDVGQADIGPPGFVSAGYSEKPVYWINELRPLIMRFIGDIKPQDYTQIIVNEIVRLVEVAEGEGFDSVVVDTDGWVRDEHGILHKNTLVEALKPDAVVVLGEELGGYFTRFRKLGIAVYEVQAPVYRKVRSREERRVLRSLRYREFLEGAQVVRVKMDNVLIEGCSVFHGLEVDTSSVSNFIEGRVVYASKLPGVLNVYGIVKSYQGDELKKLGYEKVRVYNQGFEKGLYCAVGSLNGPEYPCLVEKFDFESREVVLRTRYTGKIDVLRLSRMKLTPEYLEEYLEV